MATTQQRVKLEDAMAAAGVRVLVVRQPHDAAAAYAALCASLGGHDRAVGVDCEGIFGGGRPALMVQVASPTVVVVETPRPESRLSAPLRALLADRRTTKAFYAANGDLGAIPCDVNAVCDIARMIPKRYGQRGGLAGCIGVADPERRQWSKQSFSKRRWWRLKTADAYLEEPGFVRYAAADAWGTLRGYNWLREAGVNKENDGRAALPEVAVVADGGTDEIWESWLHQSPPLPPPKQEERAQMQAGSVRTKAKARQKRERSDGDGDHHHHHHQQQQQQQQQQQSSAAAKTYVCSSCDVDKPREDFSNSMMKRRKSTIRCNACVELQLEPAAGR
jgi:hypothetical protein